MSKTESRFYFLFGARQDPANQVPKLPYRLSR